MYSGEAGRRWQSRLILDLIWIKNVQRASNGFGRTFDDDARLPCGCPKLRRCALRRTAMPTLRVFAKERTFCRVAPRRRGGRYVKCGDCSVHAREMTSIFYITGGYCSAPELQILGQRRRGATLQNVRSFATLVVRKADIFFRSSRRPAFRGGSTLRRMVTVVMLLVHCRPTTHIYAHKKALGGRPFRANNRGAMSAETAANTPPVAKRSADYRSRITNGKRLHAAGGRP